MNGGESFEGNFAKKEITGWAVTARHLSRCRGGPTGQEDKGKCGRGATVIAGVSGLKGRLPSFLALSCTLCTALPCPSILLTFTHQRGGGCSAQGLSTPGKALGLTFSATFNSSH